MDRLDPNRSATALRALKVLETLAESRAPLPVAKVAEAIGADRSTAYRMLMTLMGAGYVTRDERTRCYQLGYKVLTLGQSLLDNDERAELILACLRAISERTQETAHFSVLDRDAAVLVLRAKGTRLVTVDFQIGDRAPLHCTSIGKVLLAFHDMRLTEAVIARGLRKVGPNTITEPDRLRSALQRIRAQGFAYDDRELAADMRCVAVPVFEKGGVVRGGISLSGPASRYTPRTLAGLKDVVVAAARDLSRQLGGPG
ncbi:IclR family transcriptional regulator [Elioraea sp.]|uniref:IclR family transcriptional regulator n=1 Tax=Elioraea sp. TaxID=2185103 RepID=UPI003F7077D0